jgi:uncharacterized protein (TIGR00159 family)
MAFLPGLEIGFLQVTIWDLLDILVVGWLIYRIYRLLRGSIALNIIAGIVLLYIAGWLVSLLKMDMLSSILSQFINVGFIIVIIIFQPEVRRFLLLLGKTTLSGRSSVLNRWLSFNLEQQAARESAIREIKSAVLRLSQEKTGALIIFSKNIELEAIGHSSVLLDANIRQSLLLSIFQKESPLHDGAVVIAGNKILAAACILPVSDSSQLPDSTGLRHRAGLGVTERTSAAALIVSEESGMVSFAEDGKIVFGLSEARLDEILQRLSL